MRAVGSLKEQTRPLDDVFVIDDGSTDGSAELVERAGFRVLRMGSNQGRGAVRAKAMEEAKHELVVSCDATNALAPDFVERAMRWFTAQSTAAVFGRMCQEDRSTVVLRWRGRHLFKTEAQHLVNRRASLATNGVLMRKSHVMAAGNFDARLHHSEDADLGGRLQAKGHEVVFDPELHAFPLATNTLPELLERYWRWYAGADERVSWRAYLRQISYSVKVMARQDLQARDPLGVPISLLSPHYQFWKSWLRRTFRDNHGLC